jgi:citronellol/citronellal dehydrogenase
MMADAAYIIFTANSKEINGYFFIDDEVLASVGILDLNPYKIN